MVPVFVVLKSLDCVAWSYHETYPTYEEAEAYLRTYYEVTSHQYWKIEKVWSWPF